MKDTFFRISNPENARNTGGVSILGNASETTIRISMLPLATGNPAEDNDDEKCPHICMGEQQA
jgi:hypothetical protein